MPRFTIEAQFVQRFGFSVEGIDSDDAWENAMGALRATSVRSELHDLPDFEMQDSGIKELDVVSEIA